MPPENFLLTEEQTNIIMFSIIMFWIGFNAVSCGLSFYFTRHKLEKFIDKMQEDITLLKNSQK